MRGYTITSGLLFAALVLVHLLRLALEGMGPLSNPVFLITTLCSGGMAVWAWVALKALSRPTAT
jgi:hypothetical protein